MAATKPLETLSSTDAETIREALLVGNRNAANGFAGLDSNGHLVGTIQNRTGTDAEIGAITLAVGEIAYTTDTQEFRIGDGSTAGGVFLFAKEQRFILGSNNSTFPGVDGSFVDYISMAVNPSRTYLLEYCFNVAFSNGFKIILPGGVDFLVSGSQITGSVVRSGVVTPVHETNLSNPITIINYTDLGAEKICGQLRFTTTDASSQSVVFGSELDNGEFFVAFGQANLRRVR